MLDVRFKAFMVVRIQVKVFSVMMLFNVVVRYQRFREISCFHLQGEDGGNMIHDCKALAAYSY